MGRWWIFIATGIVILGGTCGSVIALARFEFRHPRYPQLRFLVTRDGQVLLDPKSQLLPLKGKGTPRAYVPRNERNFGIFPPHTVGELTFEIHNIGSGSLVLQKKSTSCRCTVAELSQEIVLPGQSAHVTVVWNTGNVTDDDEYRQTVRLATNDPLRPEIEFAVWGQVRELLQCDPSEVVFDNLNPYEQRTITITISSSDGKPFRLTGSKWSTNVPGLSARFSREKKEGDRFVQLSVTADGSIPPGDFRTVLELEAVIEGGNRYRWELPVRGQRLARFAIVGPAIDADGTCSLGAVTQHVGKECALTLRVRDPNYLEPDSILAKSEIKELQVTLRDASPNISGLYQLLLCVPPNARQCNYLAQPASITIYSAKDPKDVLLELPVRFAVIRAQ